MELKYKHAVTYVWTRDIQKTKNFYKDILGFKLVFESDGWIEMIIPGVAQTYIGINKWDKEDTYPVNEFLTLGVENLDEFKEHLLNHDVQLKGDIVDFSEDGMRMLKFFDHGKNILTVTEVYK